MKCAVECYHCDHPYDYDVLKAFEYLSFSRQVHDIVSVIKNWKNSLDHRRIKIRTLSVIREVHIHIKCGVNDKLDDKQKKRIVEVLTNKLFGSRFIVAENNRCGTISKYVHLQVAFFPRIVTVIASCSSRTTICVTNDNYVSDE